MSVAAAVEDVDGKRMVGMGEERLAKDLGVSDILCY